MLDFLHDPEGCFAMMRSKFSRFGIFSILLAALALLLHARLAAAPPALDCSPANAAITAPQAGASISSLVQIMGTASLGGDFQYYKLEFAPASSDGFTVFSGLVRQQVTNAQLGVWDSASVPDGTYSIRLRIVDKTGNYCEAVVTGLHVSNSSPPTPTEVPTPVETEATPEFAVVPTAVPTINIPVATEVKAQAQTPAASGGTRTPSSSGSLPGGINVDSITSTVGDVFGGFVRAFLFGVLAAAGIMVIVGVVYFVRRVL